MSIISSFKQVDDLIQTHNVVLFSKSQSPVCSSVKEILGKFNVPYKTVELDLMEENAAAIEDFLLQKTGQSSFPYLFINKELVGNAESIIEAHNNGILLQLLSPYKIKYDFDLIVIGGGSGGLAASKEAARCGKRVAVCDYVVPSPLGTTWGLGGTCVNVGCIPKKLMHKASLVGEDIKESPYYGWTYSSHAEHDWSEMVQNIQSHIRSLNFGYRKSLKSQEVTYLNAYAQFVSPNKVRITDKKKIVKEITAQYFIIAVGGRPTYPDIPGAKEFGITSDDLFSLPYKPQKTLLIGASYIGLECAGFLSGLGMDVTVMVRSILLRGFDRQMAEFIGGNMYDNGVKFLRECIPTKIEKIADGNPGTYKVTGKFNDGTEMTDEFNTVIFAIGREACTKGLGLEEIGVTLNPKNSKVIVDSKEQTTQDNVFAIGDVIDGKPELTPVAIHAGVLLSQRLFADKWTLTDYSCIPTTIFTPLEYGCAGLSEEDAIAKYGRNNIEIFHNHYQPLEFSLPGRDAKSCYAKLLCIKNQDNLVVGLHFLGPNAGEVTQGYAIGLKLGAKKADFSNLIGIHPTCAEVFTTMNITKASGLSVEKTSC